MKTRPSVRHIIGLWVPAFWKLSFCFQFHYKGYLSFTSFIDSFMAGLGIEFQGVAYTRQVCYHWPTSPSSHFTSLNKKFSFSWNKWVVWLILYKTRGDIQGWYQWHQFCLSYRQVWPSCCQTSPLLLQVSQLRSKWSLLFSFKMENFHVTYCSQQTSSNKLLDRTLVTCLPKRPITANEYATAMMEFLIWTMSYFLSDCWNKGFPFPHFPRYLEREGMHMSIFSVSISVHILNYFKRFTGQLSHGVCCKEV